VSVSQEIPPIKCFSKTYDDPYNPAENFAAVMTCTDAEERCPVVPGSSARISLPYEDPKLADDTPQESSRYDERVYQIAAEMIYVMTKITPPPVS
ncbi:MAG: protein-tyrosine-phosphatase, partial [Cyclobacteriaceae bacterium]